MSSHDFEIRVAICVDVARYLRAAERYETACKEFNEACSALRTRLPPSCRFITKIDFKHYLVTADDGQNFEVEELTLV